MAENVDITLLVKQAQNGDMNAFEALVLQTEKIVYNIAYRMMNQGEDVKDISQEVFIKVYKNLHLFDGKSAFSTWVYRIAVNTCIDEIRKRKGKQTFSMDAELEQEESSMQVQYASTDETPEETLMRKEQQKEILEAMEKLSPEHKAVIALRELQGLSYTEVAEITNTSMGTVKSRLARARSQLKTEILKKREQKRTLPRHTFQERKEGREYEL